jgi:hypothetical protein
VYTIRLNFFRALALNFLALFCNNSFSDLISQERGSPLPGSSENVEINTLNKLVETIQDVQNGLDPEVLATWYEILEAESKALCPTEELSSSIAVVQNPDLPMKFEFMSSKRAIPYVIEAIENNLNSMPFATRLYFQKLEEIIEVELRTYFRQNTNG